MPETVPRWLLAGAGIVILVIILVEIKDFAARKSGVSPSSATSSATIVHPNAKSAPPKNSSRRRARTPAEEIADSVAQGLVRDGMATPSILGGVIQAGARSPFVPEQGVKRSEPGGVENQIRAVSAKCVPLPNSTKPGDVDVRYYQNWAREYGCGLY